MNRLVLEQLLQSAIHFEEHSRRFYLEAEGRVRGRAARRLLRELAAEEERHARLLRRLPENERLGEMLLSAATAASPPAVADETAEVPLPDGADREAILQTALSREMAAQRFYRELANGAVTETAEQLFLLLVREEARHLRRLEDLIAEEAPGG